MTTLRAIARWEGPEHPVGLRVAGLYGAVVIDLADPDNRVVGIGPSGWQITTDSPVRFYRPERMLALPVPERGGSLEPV